ncbi:unnamed protein product [Dovyalis caffra]|uniref:Uncharacterized protein n=1 Tax=Dovyalis caffra TaxID=77055 RepID=A0AAV1R279_9ROSI|nr:unnamed protein product [Dovyalis caffra]
MARAIDIGWNPSTMKHHLIKTSASGSSSFNEEVVINHYIHRIVPNVKRLFGQDKCLTGFFD